MNETSESVQTHASLSSADVTYITPSRNGWDNSHVISTYHIRNRPWPWLLANHRLTYKGFLHIDGMQFVTQKRLLREQSDWPIVKSILNSKCIPTANTLWSRQNGRHFRDRLFKGIFFNEIVEISISISRKFVPKGLSQVVHGVLIPKGPIDNNSPIFR